MVRYYSLRCKTPNGNKRTKWIGLDTNVITTLTALWVLKELFNIASVVVKYSVPLNERNKMSVWVSGGVLVFTVRPLS